MDSKSDGILTVDLTLDIDPTIFLGFPLEKMKFVSELDVESVLSEGDNLTIETYSTPRDVESQDSDTSDSNSESEEEESNSDIESERDRDINGNDETLSDFNLSWLFSELELSDDKPKLRERGPTKKHSTNKENRTTYLEKSNKYDRSQIDSRKRWHLSGSSCVQSSNSPPENNNLPAFNPDAVFWNIMSIKPVSSYPQFYEDPRANSVRSPESGYESSSTGSPPPDVLSALVNHQSEFPLFKDDDQLVDYIIENPAVCALTDPVPKPLINDRDYQKQRINELVAYFKTSSDDLVPGSLVLPQEESLDDINNFTIMLPPILEKARMPKKLRYKLKEEAKNKLRCFLSQEKFYAAEEKIFKRLIEDRQKKKPIQVIYVMDEEIRTNLHHAVLKQNIEEIYCLIEIQKMYDLGFSDLNIRDKYDKTALDYAIDQPLHHVVIDYLKENIAFQNIII